MLIDGAVTEHLLVTRFGARGCGYSESEGWFSCCVGIWILELWPAFLYWSGNQERKCLGFSLEERCVHSDTSGALRVLRDLLQLAEKVAGFI